MLVDDNGISSFIDDFGVTAWIDDLGQILGSGSPLPGRTFIIHLV